MALSNVTYTANGVTTEFVLPFSYIEEADITVTVDDVVTTDYTFNGSGNVVFNTAPLDGEVVYISRDSDVTQRVTTFIDGSALTQESLNDGGDQSLYLHQETRDLITTINADNSTVLGRVVQNETDIASNVVDIAARVEGAASSTDNAVPKFDGATGKIIQNTGVIIDDSDNISGVGDLDSDGTITITKSGSEDAIVVNRSGSGDAITVSKSGSGRDIVVNTDEFIVDDGDVTISGDTSVGGNITVTGTVDGRDVATDGAKLDVLDETSDADKPVSTATQTALDLKQDELITTRGDIIIGNASGDSVRLPLGTSGQVLKSDGTDASWGTNIAVVSFTTVTKTTTATLSTTGEDNVIVDASGGDFTVTLPPVSGNSGLTYKITSKSTGITTIEGNASETIGGELNVRLASKDDCIIITTDGTSWFYLSKGVTVAVEGGGNGGTSIVANTTNIDFTETRDTHGIFNGTQFTAESDGDYNISGTILATGASIGGIFAYIDAVADKLCGYAGELNNLVQFNRIIYLTKGEVLSFRSDTSFTLSNDTNKHTISIVKI